LEGWRDDRCGYFLESHSRWRFIHGRTGEKNPGRGIIIGRGLVDLEYSTEKANKDGTVKKGVIGRSSSLFTNVRKPAMIIYTQTLLDRERFEYVRVQKNLPISPALFLLSLSYDVEFERLSKL
jgi:hypothetical protein